MHPGLTLGVLGGLALTAGISAASKREGVRAGPGTPAPRLTGAGGGTLKVEGDDAAPGGTQAYNLANKFSGDLIISCYAGVSRKLASWPKPLPQVIEWSGEGSGHPNWDIPAQRLRNQKGQLLPGLLKQFRVSGAPKRIAAFGFSAGSRSGLRELLRNADDRAAISFVGAIDGLHASMSPKYEKWLDWNGQMQMYVEYALAAAKGTGMCVFTGNNLADPCHVSDPNRWCSTTPVAMAEINKKVVKALAGTLPAPNMDLMRRFRKLGGPKFSNEGGIGNLYMYGYPGERERDHIDQAQTVLPHVVLSFLMPHWGVTPVGGEV